METPDFIRSIDEKLSNYQPSERTMIMVGATTLILALGLDKTPYMTGTGAKRVPFRTTSVTEASGIYLPTTYSEVSKDLDQGNYVTTNVDANDVFTGTRIDDYPTQGLAVVPSNLQVIEAFEKLDLKNAKPVVFISSYVQPLIDSVKRNNGPEAARQKINKLVESLRTGMNMSPEDAGFVVVDEPQDALEDFQSVIDGAPQTEHYVARAKSLCEFAISNLSR